MACFSVPDLRLHGRGVWRCGPEPSLRLRYHLLCWPALAGGVCTLLVCIARCNKWHMVYTWLVMTMQHSMWLPELHRIAYQVSNHMHAL